MVNLVRRQSSIRIMVRNKEIGGAGLLVCLPLLASEATDLLKQAEELKQLSPDLFEWRVDGYGQATEVSHCMELLGRLRNTIGHTPLIFTCRVNGEGGLGEIERDERLALLLAAIRSGEVDIVDIEMGNDATFIREIKDAAKENGVRLMLSYHNFERTPRESFIVDKLRQARDQGADIAKIAVMPVDYRDVLVLLSATLAARSGMVDIPLVTIAMGPLGVVSRLAGGLFGSDITFAIGKETSAPGQIPIETLRQAMAALY